MKTAFETFLDSCDSTIWSHVLTELSGEIHEVDRTGVSIWFAFFPIDLHRVLLTAADPDRLAKQLLLQGDYQLKSQLDSSHRFLYGHRFWAETKRAVIEHATSFTPKDEANKAAILVNEIRQVAGAVAANAKTDVSLTLGITAVAFMTLAQTGLDSFKVSPTATEEAQVKSGRGEIKRSPEQIMRERARDDRGGVFGFLKSVDKEWTVTYDEREPTARFKTIHMEELASGAARDRSRDFRAIDARRIEGPIPVECRSASCGTCWVGVLGGAEKLSPVGRLESRQMKEFGYISTDEERPLIRLACMAQAGGAVSIVIPPWNGVFGKFLKRQKDANANTDETSSGNDNAQVEINSTS